MIIVEHECNDGSGSSTSSTLVSISGSNPECSTMIMYMSPKIEGTLIESAKDD